MSPTRHDAEWQSLAGHTYQELGHRDKIDWHYHDVQQIVYPSSGVLAISAAAATWVVPPQRAVWIPAGVPHAHQAHGPVQMRTLAISSASAVVADQPLPSGPAVLEVTPLLREVIVALTSGDGTPYTARQRASLEQVALDQLRRVDQLPVGLPTLADDRLRAIAAVLRADPADERTLAELGVLVGASERTLSRLFRQEAGMTFPQWRTQFRLQHALVLLADRTPVTTAALACGWSNPSAFIETFRRAFGATPGKFYADTRPALTGASDSDRAVESLADDVRMAGVARGLLDQVKQNVAQVALDEVRPHDRCVEAHRRGDGAGLLDLLPVIRDPVLHRVVLADHEVLGHAGVVALGPLAGEPPSGHDDLEPAPLPQPAVLDDAKQRQHARGRRHACRGVVEPFDLPDDRFALGVEEVLQGLAFGVACLRYVLFAGHPPMVDHWGPARCPALGRQLRNLLRN
jgi:AraC-like DNA-binding protein